MSSKNAWFARPIAVASATAIGRAMFLLQAHKLD